jgi:hypothetical protein
MLKFMARAIRFLRDKSHTGELACNAPPAELTRLKTDSSLRWCPETLSSWTTSRKWLT